ncbi:replication endonuclease [Burkholderia sp. LMG 13014]|uniref:replication endonuclease n=1 Tax=Burkholderia sp. LMG 13014 TaxID=2709306 RepID=UPI00196240BD|nr:replication endonuclease [Burkholderia sp. LMG 13014]
MIILNDNTFNVNTNTEDLLNYFVDNISNTYELSYVPFYNVVNDDIEEEKKHKKAFQDKRLNKLVPNIHKSMVQWIIKNQFADNEKAYIDTIPLFFDMFSNKDKKIVDDGIFTENKKERRRLNKQKKHLILYSSQLLKLIGKNRPYIATSDMVKAYKDEMKKQDDFLQSFRLVNADGKITKLISNEEKQKQRIAQILKISKCMESIAKQKGYTFSFITLTLPSSFHCNAIKGDNNSFTGRTPQEAINQLNQYWKLIRAKLSNLGLRFGDDLFGIQVIECQADSTLHLHCCLWHSEEDTDDIHRAIYKVRDNSKEFVRFDVQLNNGKAKASTYLFKYVLKTHTSYTDNNQDDNAIKNMTARNLYGIRSFNFFGLKGSITKFNFLCKNYFTYKNELPSNVSKCFQSGDLYDFITNYEKYFENAYFTEMGSKKLLGVVFKNGMFENDCQLFKQKNIIKINEVILIENRQYCVFEKTYDPEYHYIEQIDLNNPMFVNVKHSYDNVIQKQEAFDQAKEDLLYSFSYVEIEVIKKNRKYKNHSSNAFVQLFNIIQEKPALRVKYLEDDEYNMILLE